MTQAVRDRVLEAAGGHGLRSGGVEHGEALNELLKLLPVHRAQIAGRVIAASDHQSATPPHGSL